MIQELRIYTIIQGREDVELVRFEQHLPQLFARHGINCVGAWTGLAGAGGPQFVYAMAYKSLADRESQWASFYGDPDWYSIRAATQGDEEAVERYDIHFLRDSAAWTPTPGTKDGGVGGVHDLCTVEVALGQMPMVNRFLAETYLPAVERVGAEIMLVSEFVTGVRLPKVALMLAWPDLAARQAGWRALNADVAVNQARAAERKAIGRPSLGVTDTWLLEPLPFFLPKRRLGRS